MPNEDEVREVVLLTVANEQDPFNAMNVAETIDKLGFHSFRQRHWYTREHASS